MKAAILALALVACTHPGAPTEPRARDAIKPATRVEKVGDRAPVFRGKDVVSGETIGLAPGKVNLVWFWATWSVDNRAVPHVAELSRRYPELNIVMVSVDDEPRDIPEFLQTYGGKGLHSMWDEGHRVASDLFRVSCSPTFYVIDRAGVVRHTICGLTDKTIKDDLEPACKKLL